VILGQKSIVESKHEAFIVDRRKHKEGSKVCVLRMAFIDRVESTARPVVSGARCGGGGGAATALRLP